MQRELLADPDDGQLRELLDDLVEVSRVPADWRQPNPTAPTAPTLDLQLRVAASTLSL